MATVHGPQTVPARTPRVAGPRRWRWTAKQFHKLSNMGFFGDRKVELINGDLYTLPTNPPHDTAVYLTSDTLRAAFGAGYYVRAQATLDLGRRYQPLPDVLVVGGGPRDYAAKHPTAGILLVEIADSSVRRDRTIKAHRYAHAGIADYWIVNLIDRQLEIYRNPQPDPARRGRFHYADVTIVPATGRAAPLARPQAMIAVADLLP
ncbi:MAG TPA: Uma2 family endonuclease [Isosphaeraceae bacterium]|nr:Uma2 family endonuclease [Isosphaeraceae bacterium]